MLSIESGSKIYPTRRGELKALDDVSLVVKQGEFVVVKGPSGSGKTTLLLTFGGMLHPTRGVVRVDETELYAMTSSHRARFRARHIGFIFQMFHLVPYLTVLDNVLLSPIDRGPETVRRARALIERFGIDARADHKPAALSAGERQRTAIARALLHRPKVVLADEPTGNLDPDNAKQVFEHLVRYQSEGGTVMVVTHGDEAGRHADRIIRMNEGRIENGAGAG